ncbi:MAG: MBL fold metallo-hydrolase [Candidatus Schekmanbacteria bacterium]|nr:MAG: MBL fold metallo-hydrolase [Candidatus Schekmanbacteria bacterium]
MSHHGVFEIDLGLSRAFYIDGMFEKVLVDTGLKPMSKEVIDFFAANNMPFSDEQLNLLRKGSRSTIMKFLKNNGFKVDVIICTHCHGDHIGNAAQLKDELNVPLAAHKDDVPVIEGREFLPKPEMIPQEFHHHFDCTPCQVDIVLEDGQHFNEEIDVIHLEGHTKGSICLLVKDIVLIAGDCILGKGAMGGENKKPLNPPSKEFCADYDLALKSLKKLMNYHFEAIFPSHGASIKTGAKRELESLLKELNL